MSARAAGSKTRVNKVVVAILKTPAKIRAIMLLRISIDETPQALLGRGMR